MHRGGRPPGKTVVTINKEHQTDETANPEKKRKRVSKHQCKKFNFFTPHVRPMPSTSADDSISVSVFSPANVCVCFCLCVCPFSPVCVCVLVWVCVCAHVHIHIYIYIYMYIHIHMYSPVQHRVRQQTCRNQVKLFLTMSLSSLLSS